MYDSQSLLGIGQHLKIKCMQLDALVSEHEYHGSPKSSKIAVEEDSRCLHSKDLEDMQGH